jgi:hypothetical protein
VCPAKLSASGFKRTHRKRAAFQVLAEMHAGNRIHPNGSRTFAADTKSGFLEQTKAIYLPGLPFPGIDPNVNAALSQAKEQIGLPGDQLTPPSTPFYPHRLSLAYFESDRIDLDAVDRLIGSF